MSIEMHLAELQKRHAKLERDIQSALLHPSSDDLDISRMKRDKLQLKDEIARLSVNDNYH